VRDDGFGGGAAFGREMPEAGRAFGRGGVIGGLGGNQCNTCYTDFFGVGFGGFQCATWHIEIFWIDSGGAFGGRKPENHMVGS